MSCDWVAGKSHSSPPTEAKPRSPYLVSQRNMNSVNTISLYVASLEWLCYHEHESLVQKSILIAFESTTLRRQCPEGYWKANILRTADQKVYKAHVKK